MKKVLLLMDWYQIEPCRAIILPCLFPFGTRGGRPPQAPPRRRLAASRLALTVHTIPPQALTVRAIGNRQYPLRDQ